ncbi:putative ribonuclease H-like domain-containing protein [Tanacetum coccineum]
MVVAYKTGLQYVEERLEFYKKNESVYVEKINGLKWDIQVGEITIGELRKKLEIVQKEKDGIQFNVDKFVNASKSLNKIIESQIVDNCKKEEFTNEPIVIKHVVENSEAKASEAKPKAVRKNNGALIIEDWVSDSEEENVSQTKIEKKTTKLSFVKIDFVKAKQTSKTDRKTAKQANEGFFVGYSLNSKTFRVFNSRTRIMEENLNIRFGENTPNAEGSRPEWIFDIDALTRTMNYEPIVAAYNKVEKALYGLHQAPRAWYETLSTYLLDNEFQRGEIDKTLFIKRFTEVKTAITPMKNQKPLLKDEDGEEVDVHMYRSMIGSLMYLTSSRPDIMFAVCYLKGQPKLGLWYLKDSPFDLVAYTDSDYAGESLDMKSTTGGCQFLEEINHDRFKLLGQVLLDSNHLLDMVQFYAYQDLY